MDCAGRQEKGKIVEKGVERGNEGVTGEDVVTEQEGASGQEVGERLRERSRGRGGGERERETEREGGK